METGLIIPLELLFKAPDKVLFTAIIKKIAGLVSLLILLLVSSISNRSLFVVVKVVFLAIIGMTALLIVLILNSVPDSRVDNGVPESALFMNQRLADPAFTIKYSACGSMCK